MLLAAAARFYYAETYLRVLAILFVRYYTSQMRTDDYTQMPKIVNTGKRMPFSKLNFLTINSFTINTYNVN